MFDYQTLNQLAQAALREAGGLALEVTVEGSEFALTRFAEGEIHQNLSMEGRYATVRLIDGGRTARVKGSAPTEAAMAALVASAREALRYAEEGPDVRLPGSDQGWGVQEENSGADLDLYERGLAWRTEAVQDTIRMVEAVGPRAFGRAITECNGRLILNTEGLVSYAPRTRAELVVATISADGYGLAHGRGVGMAAIDPEALARQAAETAQTARHPQPLAAGEYPVVLLPAATADILGFIGSLGADAQAVQEGRSFMAPDAEPIRLSPEVTLYDDGHDARGCPLPFDAEGVQKERVDIIAEGQIGSPVHTQATARWEGRLSTGHAPVFRPFDTDRGGSQALPQNLFMVPGTTAVEEMIAGIDYGVLVSTFHYTRPLEPRKVRITGMTRNGTFLIERGEVTRPVRNLRFTDSYLRLLQGVRAVGNEPVLCGDGVGGIYAPALALESLRFTGTTEF